MLLTVAAVMVTGVVTLATVRSHTPSPLERTDAEVVADALPRLEFVREALHEGAGTAMQELFPEGYFFTHALYGLTWLSEAQRDPDLQDRALREARWSLKRLYSPEGTGPFSSVAVPAYGVFHAGWSAWLRGQIVAVAGGPEQAPEEMAALDAAAEEIAEAFEASLAHGTPYLTSYPGQAWPVDNVVAMAALRLRDHLAGEDRYAALFRLWMTEVRARLDPATGLIPHRVDPVTGHPVEGARHSQTLLLRFPVRNRPRVGGRRLPCSGSSSPPSTRCCRGARISAGQPLPRGRRLRSADLRPVRFREHCCSRWKHPRAGHRHGRRPHRVRRGHRHGRGMAGQTPLPRRGAPGR